MVGPVIADLNLLAARNQMALSLGFHIVLACLGIGFPLIALIAHWRGLRTGDPHYLELARRWAKTMAVLFAVGLVAPQAKPTVNMGRHNSVRLYFGPTGEGTATLSSRRSTVS